MSERTTNQIVDHIKQFLADHTHYLVLNNDIEDLVAIIRKREKEAENYRRQVAGLNRWIADLQSGMYINCVYCGHHYGPDPGTPTSMAEVLKQHIEVCPKHPMSALKAERDRYRKALKEISESQWGGQCCSLFAHKTLTDSAPADPQKQTSGE